MGLGFPSLFFLDFAATIQISQLYSDFVLGF